MERVIYTYKPKRFGVTQPFLNKEEKPLSDTHCGHSHSTAVRVMDAIFAVHLRGFADPFPPIPLLVWCVVDAGKPAHTQTSRLFGWPWKWPFQSS
jgi:hypothetical protein